MKTAIFSLAWAAIVGAAPSNSAIFGLDIDGHAVSQVFPRARCNANNVLRDLRNARVSSSASEYCSALLQSTDTVGASTTVVTTAIILTTTTTTIQTTTTLTVSSGASTVTSSNICGVHGFGNAAFNIFQDNTGTYANANACYALCMTKSAVSFGFGMSTCACYSVKLAAFQNRVDTSPYAFYDFGCPLPSTPSKRDVVEPSCIAKPLTTPPYLTATYGLSRISSACSCFISSPSAACTVTSTSTISQTSTATNTNAVTETAVSTVIVVVPSATVTFFSSIAPP